MASISKVLTFTPTIGDNDKKPESERFQVKIKAVKSDVKQTHLRKFIEMDPKKLMAQMMDPRQQGEIKDLLTKNFVRFINFNVTDEVTEEDVNAGNSLHLKGDSDTTKVTADHLSREYERPATMDDIFELGEFELALEIFMHMIGSSQLRKTIKPQGDGGGGGGELPTVTEEREDEEKNSVSPSGTTQTPNVH
jgi:hypothetical protein